MSVELAILTPVMLAACGLVVGLIGTSVQAGQAQLAVESSATRIGSGLNESEAVKSLLHFGKVIVRRAEGRVCVGVTGANHIFGLVGFDVPLAVNACADETPKS